MFYFFHIKTSKICVWENKIHRSFSVLVIIIVTLVLRWKKYKKLQREVLDNDYSKNFKYTLLRSQN